MSPCNDYVKLIKINLLKTKKTNDMFDNGRKLLFFVEPKLLTFHDCRNDFVQLLELNKVESNISSRVGIICSKFDCSTNSRMPGFFGDR